MEKLRESVFLTARTTAMVCFLFVGSAIFSSVFGCSAARVRREVRARPRPELLGFMIMAQAIIFLLGWPLEWTEIIIIFVPIFLPLLDEFGIDPLFFGVMVALNLQTSFLSPPVAMAPFYLEPGEHATPRPHRAAREGIGGAGVRQCGRHFGETVDETPVHRRDDEQRNEHRTPAIGKAEVPTRIVTRDDGADSQRPQ